MSRERMLVTGATGFIGRALCRRLTEMAAPVRVLARDTLKAGHVFSAAMVDGSEQSGRLEIAPFDESDNVLASALRDVSVVFHLAARAHILRETAADPEAAFRQANYELTCRLASAAAAAGVRRFVFVSSIGVNGSDSGNIAFTEEHLVRPHDLYARFKWEAEQVLRKIAESGKMEVVVVRPPLVYGPNVAGNFFRLLALVFSGVPLPFASVHNRRSLIYVGNLVDALIRAADHTAAKNELFLISDGEDLSTAELVMKIANCAGARARLFSVPVTMLRLVGKLINREKEIGRLVGSLVVDSRKIRRELGWSPPYSVDEGLQQTANWFKRTRQA